MEKQIIVSMERQVTVSETKGALTSVATYRHKELDKALYGIERMIVDYPYGDEKRRDTQLNKLGYYEESTVWFNDDAPHSPIRRIYSR